MNTLNMPTPVEPMAPPRIVIDRSHPGHRNQSEAGLAVLNHVANQPDGCGLDELLLVFCAAKATHRTECATADNLLCLLYKLAQKNHLFSHGRGQSSLWHLGMSARITSHDRALPAAPYVGLRTPPPQYDVMRGAVYAPARGPVPRAGSLDCKALKSHGYGC